MNDTDGVAIYVDGVSKDFHLPNQRAGSLKSVFTQLFGYLTKKRIYDTQHALKDITFDIKKGEFFGIVGRNGSGKSTLLKMLAGIYQPNKGSVTINGRLVPFIELGVGFNPELTGRENVYLNGALLGFSKREVDGQYDDIVGFAELGPFMDQKLKNYSSGMQVRLAFSMAVRARTEILLIDEVLAVGDADFQRKCFEYFNQLKKANTTVVFVSHDMDAVRKYCDRAMLIEKNKILDIGDTDKIADKYARLFMDENAVSTNKNSDEGKRWGDQGISISKVTVKTNMQTVVIEKNIRVNRAIEGMIAGIRIRDTAGNDITGTNTKIERQKLPPMNSGSVVVVKWTIPNIFTDGTYVVDPSVLYDDGITVADWWNEAVLFTVTKYRHVPYVVNPGFKLDINYKVRR